jgi:hypothetical protein
MFRVLSKERCSAGSISGMPTEMLRDVQQQRRLGEMKLFGKHAEVSEVADLHRRSIIAGGSLTDG